MTTTTDLNRRLWQERAAGDDTRAWESLTTEPTGLDEQMSDLGLWLRPPGAPGDSVLVAVHGGGFVSGSIATHRRMFGHLALAAGRNTLVVEYGLVPAHVFPAQLDQLGVIYRALPGRVAIAGDSCGATLALGLALREDPPEALVLFSPWVDFTGERATTGDPFFTAELIQGLAAAYLAGAEDPYDPSRADLGKLPPTYVQVGGDEALLADARLLAARAPQVVLDEFPGQLHTFQMAAGNSPVADDAIARAGRWLRRTLG
ncbi:alpha/beta hydrolase [Actinoplanes sp. LDG1-06]|uniref:Alpha/beta hydrolase n=1 Tax=Paractinoplanes ovalisporus TaxID=2810368 RepID=A0ABS2A4P4_9ACTN|nr:alpha/beta hydrolase [Actinoplanes ovalisporus]MBM2614799.1 alpha/beta hydrolase [Actinoplanes ovalisporus]